MPHTPQAVESTSQPVSRRTVLRLGAAAAAGAATGPFVWTPARAQGFNWKRFQGKELFFILSKHPWVEVLEKNMPEFESLTGMKVKWETLPEIQARQKLVVEMTSGSGGVDGFFTSLHVEKKRFWKAGWYEPLNKYLQDRTLTPADWDWDDVAGGAKSIITQKDGSISALPAFVDAVILFYRKDLYAAKGLKPPKTHDEWAQQAKALHAPPGMYGVVWRGLKNANATMFSNTQFAFGADFLNKDGKAALDTPETAAALDWYAGNLRQYGPPGAINFNWYECSSTFFQGQAATYFDGINFANQFEDPSKSKIVGKVGYAPMPTGPKGQFSSLYGTGMAVSTQSRNKEAAYLLVQWSTNKANAARELLAGVGVARNSPWNDPEVKAKPKMPPDWYQAYQDSLKIGKLGLPEIVGVTEYRDIIGVAIQKAIEGAPSAQVLAQANKEFQEMLTRTEG